MQDLQSFLLVQDMTASGDNVDDSGVFWPGFLSQPLKIPKLLSRRKKLVQRVVGNATASDGRPKWHEDESVAVLFLLVVWSVGRCTILLHLNFRSLPGLLERSLE